MSEKLLITPDEFLKGTILGGNIQPNRFLMCIASVQMTTIEPLLGTELYNKLVDDYSSETLAGNYAELYDYVKDIIKNLALSEFIQIGSFLVENGGIFKHDAENRTQPTSEEINMLSNKYRALADIYITRCEKLLKRAKFPEYKRYQEKVGARKITDTIGIYIK